MNNEIEAALLALDERAFDRGDRLTIDKFVELTCRRHPKFPWDVCYTVAHALADDGRLKTITNRPTLHARGPLSHNYGARRAQLCRP